jgi:hypothetical protein
LGSCFSSEAIAMRHSYCWRAFSLAAR